MAEQTEAKCPYCGGSGVFSLQRATIGETIRARRVNAGMSQRNLAKKIGRSSGQVAAIETGRSDMPTKMLKPFAEALGCSVADLLPAEQRQ